MEKESIKNRLSRLIPTRRRIIQLYAALLTNANIRGFVSGKIFTGGTKYACVPGLNCYSCPGAVGACPLGALQNSMAESGTRTPYYVIGILALFGLIFARTICGFLCPFGLVQELLFKLKTPKLKKNSVTRKLSYFKYFLLFALVLGIPLVYAGINLPVPAFCKYVCPAGTLGGAVSLLINPSNADYFTMLGGLFTWKFALLALFLTACVFIYRFFCRFFCPLGAIYGFFAPFALLGVTVDEEKCTGCGLCVSHCKVDIRRVGDHECVQCGECISICPTKAISRKGSKIFIRANETMPAQISPSVAGAAEPTAAQISPSVAGAAEPIAAQISPSVAGAAEPIDVQKDLDKPQSAASTGEGIRGECGAANTDKVKRQKPPKTHKIAPFHIALAALSAFTVAFVLIINFACVPKATGGLTSDSAPINKGVKVGDTLPQIFAELYGENEGERADVSASSGKIKIINYWGTWCTPCVQELPFFRDIAIEFEGYVEIIALHSKDVTANVPNFIKEKFGDYPITFAHDTEDSYHVIAGAEESTWPVTVIALPSGEIIFVRKGSITYADLAQAITPFLSAVG